MQEEKICSRLANIHNVSQHSVTFDLLQQSGMYVATLLIASRFIYTELAGLEICENVEYCGPPGKIQTLL